MRISRWLVSGAPLCALAVLGAGTAQAEIQIQTRPVLGASEGVARFALVIGNNQPEASGTARLRYADDDAVATQKLLLEAGVNSLLLARIDADTGRLHPQVRSRGLPRGASFDAAVASLFAAIKDQAGRGRITELLIFYSGHGDVTGGEGYVLLEDRRIMRSDLYALLARSPATHNHVFVDACKSYFFAFEKAAGGRRTSYVHSFAPEAEPGRLDNVGFVLSTSSDRDSHEWERFQAGILSYELRSALRGAADVDTDGRVTYAELGAFLTRANGAIQNPKFRPDFLVRPPAKNLHQEVLRWGDKSTAVHLSPRAAGSHLYIENARGERILDAHAARGQGLAVHIPDERPMFVRRHDESSEYVIRNPAPVTVAAIEGAPPAIASRGALHLAFEQLFSTPFGAGDVTAFETHQNSLMLQHTAAEARRARRDAGRTTAAMIGIGGAVAGLALNGLAYRRYLDSEDAPQADIARANASIRRLNLTSIVFYGVAAVAGATWGWLTWGDDVSIDLESTSSEGGGGVGLDGFAISVGRAF